MNANVTLLGFTGAQWTVVSDIATTVSAIAFIISLMFVFSQLRQMRISTMAIAFSKALDILQDEQRRIDRRTIFMLDEGVEQWTDEQRAAGERVIHSYDQVGTMVRAKMLDKELIVDSWGNSLRQAKPLLMPMVLEYRDRWQSEEIWDGFEWLCDEAEKFKMKR